MSDLETKLEDLKKMNSDLVLKVQYWKMNAAQRENEKLELIKELNETRLKLNRLITGGSAEARKLEIALQASSEEALSHLVQASSALAKTMEMTKAYMSNRQDLETNPPRWSAISGTPATEKVHKVRPMLLGGRSLQPVVALHRAVLDNSNNNSSRSPNQRSNITQRALPMHMLQDVYIPLTRIEVTNDWTNTLESRENADDSTENLGLNDDSGEGLEESRNISDSEDNDVSRRLNAVPEDVEPGDEVETPPPLRNRVDNPLEGPSWLLDRLPFDNERKVKSRPTLEPDSTTGVEETTQATVKSDDMKQEAVQAAAAASVFTPTVRRKRSAAESPVLIPNKKAWCSDRVLQVLVPKMRLDSSPTSRRPEPRFDAPSPNGATDSAVIVSEALCSPSALGEPAKITSRNRSKEFSVQPVRVNLDDSDRRQSDSPRNVSIHQQDFGIDSNETPEVGVSHSRKASQNVSQNVSHDGHDDTQNERSQNDSKVSRGDRNRNDDNDNDTPNNCNSKRNRSDCKNIVSRNERSRSQDESESSNASHKDNRDNSPNDSRAESNVSQRNRNVSQRNRTVSQRERSVSRSRRDGSESRENSYRDSDSSGNEIISNGRTRRQRKPITYKEKPLNRKLRR